MKKLFFITFFMINISYAADSAQVDSSAPNEIIKKVTDQISNTKTNLSEILDEQRIHNQLERDLLKLDLEFDQSLLNINIVDGINLSTKYHYEVNPSYQDQFYTRIDKYDLDANINPGTLLKGQIDMPFGFGISRNSSFLFVRQFQSKIDALKAIPYGPQKLPLNAKHALELNVGDFVSIPANLNYVFSVGVSSATLPTPLVVDANASAYFVVSGEFTIQVFKLDENHVRVKLISTRGLTGGVNSNMSFGLTAFGFKIVGQSNVDRLLDQSAQRLVESIVDKDLLQFGMNYNPGANFIADYVFDLTDTEAQAAYNQILSSAYKLKDVVVTDRLLSAKNLQDKLITTTDLADKIFDKEISKKNNQMKVMRIFKGFNNFKSTTDHLKLAFLIASYNRDITYTENKLTFTDKNENSMEFFYPTFSKYWETNFGKWIFNLKDQSNKSYFGLIPRFNSEDADLRDPDLGVTFERRDKIFASYEQSSVERYMIGQLPNVITKGINLDEWKNGDKKLDSRVFFQLILKSQGFKYLRLYTEEEFRDRLIKYSMAKKQIHIITRPPESATFENPSPNNPNILENLEIKTISTLLYHALHDAENVSEKTLTKIIKLNQIPLFENVGIGFLISLLPEEKLNDLIYIKLEMIAKDVHALKAEYGKLNYKSLYNEINTVQSRLSNRSYDLRLTPEDIQIENSDTQVLDSEVNAAN